MASKLNSEFNYRTQVVGETPWEKIKTLKGFLEGRKRALAMESVALKKKKAARAKLEWLKQKKAPLHKILLLEAEILESESFEETEKHAFELTKQEIVTIEKLLKELYEQVEPTRIEGYTDEQMFELNAANEFTVWCAREIHSEILAYGHPSAARLKNAMSSPQTWEALKQIGLVPENAPILENNDPRQIDLKARINNELLTAKTGWNNHLSLLSVTTENGQPNHQFSGKP